MAASPQKPNGEITPLHIKVLCEKLKSKYDYVIVDAPAGIDDGMIIATGGCDMGIIVVTPEYASLRNAETVKKTIKAQGIDNICYVVNRIDLRLIESGKAPSFDEVTKNIREKIVGIIQEDENIHVSTNLGVPIVSMTDTYIAKSFMAMADRIKKNLEKNRDKKAGCRSEMRLSGQPAFDSAANTQGKCVLRFILNRSSAWGGKFRFKLSCSALLRS